MEISVEDIRQIYVGSLVLYRKKTPVFMEAIAADRTVRYYDLRAQKNKEALFSLQDFTSPAVRIGFVNALGSVIFGYRTPIRRYKVGFCEENTHFDYLDIHYPSGTGTTKRHVSGMRCGELADALMNKYPSLEECSEHVAKFAGAMAFDKQFCLTSDREVYYRTNPVGTLAKGKKATQDIKFHDRYKHLSLLLDGNYEKTLSTARA